jgi:hypothetical protein
VNPLWEDKWAGDLSNRLGRFLLGQVAEGAARARTSRPGWRTSNEVSGDVGGEGLAQGGGGRRRHAVVCWRRRECRCIKLDRREGVARRRRRHLAGTNVLQPDPQSLAKGWPRKRTKPLSIRIFFFCRPLFFFDGRVGAERFHEDRQIWVF